MAGKYIALAAAILSWAAFAEIEVPENWVPRKIKGRDFVLGGVFWPGPESKRPDWAMYRMPSLTRVGWAGDIGFNDIKWWRARPENERFKALPYKVYDFLGPNVPHNQLRKLVASLESRPDALYKIRATDSWFPWFMKDSYDCDKADYAEFVKTHKNFICFDILNESDGSFDTDFSKAEDPAIKAQMLRDYPLCTKPGDKQRRLKKAMEREQAMHFGCGNFSSTYCQNCKWGQALAKYGVRAYHNYEMEMNASSGPFAFGMFHARGVARQWGIPFMWYTAPLVMGYTRDGKKNNEEWQCVRRGHENVDEDCGGSISLVMRNCFYGFMGGAAGIELENTNWCFFDDRDIENPKPSKYAIAFNNMAELCEKTERGVPFVPVVALTPLYEDFYRFGYNKHGCRNGFAQNAFFFTLVPTLREDPYRMSDRKNGDLGCLWNSEFGELCDVMCPDAGKEAGDFSRCIAPYKWAFLIGGYENKSEYDGAAIEAWVRAGGTLVCSYDAIEEGLVSEEMAGIVVGKETAKSAHRLCDASGRTVDRLCEQYTFHKALAKGAKIILKDDKGTEVAYENAFGKGCVITVMAYQSIPDRFLTAKLPDDEDAWFHKGQMADVSSGRTQFPIQKFLLREARDTTMPVAVEGDVQWGVNFVEGKREEGNGKSGGYLVWLMNNKGVTKFEQEPEVVDHAFDAKVKITNKKSGKSIEVTVPAGGYTWRIL